MNKIMLFLLLFSFNCAFAHERGHSPSAYWQQLEKWLMKFGDESFNVIAKTKEPQKVIGKIVAESNNVIDEIFIIDSNGKVIMKSHEKSMHKLDAQKVIDYFKNSENFTYVSDLNFDEDSQSFNIDVARKISENRIVIYNIDVEHF